VSDGGVPSEPRPRLGVGSLVRHRDFGSGRVVGYEGDTYVVLFRGGEVRRVAFSFPDMQAEAAAGDPELDRIRQAVREVLGDHGWLDVDLELGKRWVGGTLRLIPGKEGTQPKDVPLEVFFKKIIGIRDRLRVLEQKLNSHPTLTPEEKLELQGYISRCYGSLTTFNVLFGAEPSHFRGQGDRDSQENR
jgi:hypothetical protein